MLESLSTNSITRASENDIDQIRLILETNQLPVDDINNDIIFFVKKVNNSILAVGGIEFEDDTGLIRSVAVEEKQKGQGFGLEIAKFIIEFSKKRGIFNLFLLTTTAERFFRKFGFEEINKESAPKFITRTREFKDLCPDTAVLMHLNLNAK